MLRRLGLLLGLLLVSACSAPAVEPVRVASPAEATEQLAALRVAPRQPAGPAYDRDAFGTAWADVDGNGCNQRDDVLLRDAVPDSVTVARQGGCGHDVLAGS